MIRSPLQIPNFRRLWLGQILLWFAQQGWFVGLTWLVLQKTGSGFALGTLLMAGSIPTAIFTIVGGAISDRFSPKWVATVANLVNTFLAGILVLLLWMDAANIPLLIGITALAGLADAFAYPAIGALLPGIVNRARLVQANAWIQGAEQMKDALAPAITGLAIAALGLPITFVWVIRRNNAVDGYSGILPSNSVKRVKERSKASTLARRFICSNASNFHKYQGKINYTFCLSRELLTGNSLYNSIVNIINNAGLPTEKSIRLRLRL